MAATGIPSTDTATPALISHREILRLDLPLDRLFAAVEAAFLEHAKGAVEMPPKIGVHTRADAFLHAMPAYIPAIHACGVKWVGGYPENPKRGLPTIAGLMILNDPETGLPLAVLDARWITAVRTAIVSALIARTCARPDARVLAVAGCGAQGREHLRCFLHVLPHIEEVRLYDTCDESARRTEEDAVTWTHATIRVCDSPETCLRGASVIATCTSGRALEVLDDWLALGGTAVGVDSRVVWGRLLGKTDKFVTDDERQAREFEKHGKYPGGLPKIHAELGQILAGTRPGRQSSGERILGLPLGLAIADLAVAQLVWKSLPAP